MRLPHIAAALAAALPAAAAAPAPPLGATLANQAGAGEGTAELERLMRLQLAAARYNAAEATALRLAARYRPTEPGRAASLLPWRIYARAMRDETAGLASRDALAEAFGALFSSLPDAGMADALPWFGTDPDRLRDAVQRAERACESAPLDACASAADVVAARQSAAVWAYLMPASQPLIRADVERRFLVEEELVPTPDGTGIAALVVRPRDAAKRTALLNFTIYAREDWALSDATKMAAHGYAGVVAYSRGKGRGAGPIIPYAHDGADAAATIDWIARQAWSDGRVGMFSGSYNAFTQWAALKHRPAALRAIATNASNAPGIDTPMQGNVFRTFIYPWPLYVASGRGLDESSYGDRARWSALERNWYRSGRPYRDLEAIDGQPNPVFRTWLSHPAYDSWWQSMIPAGREFARIDTPVFVETGYFDGGMVGALHYLRAHLRWRPGADHRLLLGPYTHTAMQTGVLPSVNGIAIDRAAMIDLQDVRLSWFDHVFRGAPLPAILSDRVNFEVMGANLWRHVANLDAMADGHLRLYLGGPADSGGFRFADAPPAASAVEPELRVDLADRRDVDDPGPAEGLDTRNALLFASPPLPQPIEVDGAFRARLEIVANKKDLDLSIAFFEQRADGHFFPLASHLVRVSYAENPGRRHLLEPGRSRRLDIESQTVAARRLAAGSRIVALIGVPRRPDMEINYGTGGDVADESIADAGAPLRVRFRRGGFFDLGVRRRTGGEE